MSSEIMLNLLLNGDKEVLQFEVGAELECHGKFSIVIACKILELDASMHSQECQRSGG
jgi:hypothetical protein